MVIASGGVTRDCRKGLFTEDALVRRKVIPRCLRSGLSIIRVLRVQKPCKLALDLDKIKSGVTYWQLKIWRTIKSLLNPNKGRRLKKINFLLD